MIDALISGGVILAVLTWGVYDVGRQRARAETLRAEIAWTRRELAAANEIIERQRTLLGHTYWRPDDNPLSRQHARDALRAAELAAQPPVVAEQGGWPYTDEQEVTR